MTYAPGQLVRIRARLRADRAGVVDHVTRTQVVLRTGERFSLKTGRLLGVGVSTTRLEPWEPQRMEQTGLVFPEAPKRVQTEIPPEALRALHEGGQEWLDSLAYSDDGCGWCGDANCEGGCPDNPRNPEACS